MNHKKGVPFGTPFLFGGEGGIRTLDTRKRIHTFQACSFSHSDTSPEPGCLAVSASTFYRGIIIYALLPAYSALYSYLPSLPRGV